MRVYIIGNDGITLCREAPAASTTARLPLHRTRNSRCPAQRQAVAGAVERSARCRKAKESWRPRRADRSAVVCNRGLAGRGASTRPEAPLEAGRGDCDAASAQVDGRRGGERDRLAASYRSRRLLGNLEEKARAYCCLGQRRPRPGLPHRRAGEPMKSQIHDASARQHSGEPFSGLSPNDARDRLHTPDLAEVDGEIARLVDRSTQELRRVWRTLHHTGPPLGLSRDLIIRGLADQLQQRAHGAPAVLCSAAFGFWRQSSRKALVLSIPPERSRPARPWCGNGGGHPYRPRARGRVRIRRPALSVSDDDCRADHRGTLVGPPVLRS